MDLLSVHTDADVKKKISEFLSLCDNLFLLILQENYTANRMVLAAYGVDHEHLISIAEPLLYDLNRGPPVEVPKSSYTGGDFRHKVDSEVI